MSLSSISYLRNHGTSLSAACGKIRANAGRQIGDVRLAIDERRITESDGTLPHRPLAWLAISALLALALIGLSIGNLRRVPEESRIVRFSVSPPEGKGFFPNSPPAVSPDGRHLALVTEMDGNDSLWVRDIDSVATRRLPGTENAFLPFWSPDSRFIGFFATGKLRRIDVRGGRPTILCDAPNGVGGSWNQNDVIVFGPDQRSGLFRVPATGGTPTPVTTLNASLGETHHHFPWFLPDGRRFLFSSATNDIEKSGIYVADLDSQSRIKLLPLSSNAVYTQPGWLLYDRERTLVAQGFDATKLQLMPDPVVLVDDIDEPGIFTFKHGLFSASQNGILLYSSGIRWGQAQLTWMDRSGKVVGTIGRPGLVDNAAVSPDGSTIAFERWEPGAINLWMRDLKRGTESKFTYTSTQNRVPKWSADGTRIVFSSDRDGSVLNLYQKDLSGSSPEERIVASKPVKFATDWSRDSRYIVYDEWNDNLGSIWILPLFGDRKPFSYLQACFSQHYGRLSPNGRWLAYVSHETGRGEIYVQPFPNHGIKYPVSSNGGDLPNWSADGKELFFMSTDAKIMGVEVKTSDAKFAATAPKALFQTHADYGTTFDVSKDGNFLISMPLEQSGRAPMTVVLNWPALLKK
jgi:Tol biopolymer transport system component